MQHKSLRIDVISDISERVLRVRIAQTLSVRDGNALITATNSGDFNHWQFSTQSSSGYRAMACALLSTPRYSSLRSFAMPEMLTHTNPNQIIRVSAAAAYATP